MFQPMVHDIEGENERRGSYDKICINNGGQFGDESGCADQRVGGLREGSGDQRGGGGGGGNLLIPLLRHLPLGSGVGGELLPRSPPTAEHKQTSPEHIQTGADQRVGGGGLREDSGDQKGGGGGNLLIPLLRHSPLGSGVGGELLPCSPTTAENKQTAPEHMQAALEHIQAAHEHIQDASIVEHIQAAHEHIQAAQDAILRPQVIPVPAPPTRCQVFIRIFMWPSMLAMSFGLLQHYSHSFTDKIDSRHLSPFAFSLSLTAQMTSTVGYGDIVPDSVWAKVLTSLVSFFLGGVLSYVGDLFLMTLGDCFIKSLKHMLVDWCISEHTFDSVVGMLEFLVPLFAPILCVVVGVLVFHRLTKLTYLDCLYLSVITITTLGYGDIDMSADAVIFASLWMWLSTIIYAKCAYYLSCRLAIRLGIV